MARAYPPEFRSDVVAVARKHEVMKRCASDLHHSAGLNQSERRCDSRYPLRHESHMPAVCPSCQFTGFTTQKGASDQLFCRPSCLARVSFPS
jgi:hypothetical protein